MSVLTIVGATALTLIIGEKFIAQLLVKPNIAALEDPYMASELPSIPETEVILTMTPLRCLLNINLANRWEK